MGIGRQIDVLEAGKISPAVTLPTVYTSGISPSGMDQLSFIYEPEISLLWHPG
jgi:hypothetical protein